MDLYFIILTALIGFVSGIFGGLLGIGGSIVMIPLLTLVHGPNQQLYQAAAMIVNIPVAASATIKHALKKVIDRSIVLRLLPAALVGIVVGVFFSNEIPTNWLQMLFALFLVYVGTSEIISILRERLHEANSNETTPQEQPDAGALKTSTVGGINGLVAGLLGIGGGVVLIPLLQRVCRIPVRASIAASSATMLVTATVGACYKNLTLPELQAPDGSALSIGQSLMIAAAMIPTAFIGSYLGASLTHKLPVRAIKVAFSILVLVAAARMAWTAFVDLETPPAAADPALAPITPQEPTNS